jgi:hypothetical protein
MADSPDDQRNPEVSASAFPLRHPMSVSVAADIRPIRRSALALASDACDRPAALKPRNACHACSRRCSLTRSTIIRAQSVCHRHWRRTCQPACRHLPRFARPAPPLLRQRFNARDRPAARMPGYFCPVCSRRWILTRSTIDRTWSLRSRHSWRGSQSAHQPMAHYAIRACAFAPALRRSRSRGRLPAPKRLTSLLATRRVLQHRAAPKFATSFAFAHRFRATNPLASPRSTQPFRRPNSRLITHLFRHAPNIRYSFAGMCCDACQMWKRKLIARIIGRDRCEKVAGTGCRHSGML